MEDTLEISTAVGKGDGVEERVALVEDTLEINIAGGKGDGVELGVEEVLCPVVNVLENNTAGGRGDEGGDEQVEGVEEPVATRVPLTVVSIEEQLRLLLALQRPIPQLGFGLYALLNIVYSVKLLFYL